MRHSFARRASAPSVSFLIFAAAAGLSWTPHAAQAGVVVDAPPIADGMMWDKHNDDSFETLYLTAPNLNTQSFASANGIVGYEERSALEFNLVGLGGGGPLIRAYLSVNVTGTSTPDGFAELTIDFRGYTGNGQVTLADAFASEIKIGELTVPGASFDAFGRHDVPLDLDFVRPYIGSANVFGILTYVPIDHGGITFESVDSFPIEGRPYLRLVFAVPEPGARLLAALSLAALLPRGIGRLSTRRKRNTSFSNRQGIRNASCGAMALHRRRSAGSS